MNQMRVGFAAAIFVSSLASAVPIWKEVSTLVRVRPTDFAYDIPLWDMSNVYSLARFHLPPNTDIVIKIEDTFPKGRYFAYSVYDQTTADRVHRFSSTHDQRIVPDEGSYNPFQRGFRALMSPSEDELAYTIWAVPEKWYSHFASKFPNVIVATAGALDQHVELVRRVYAPYDRRPVAVPKLTFYNADNLDRPIPLGPDVVNVMTDKKKDFGDARANRSPEPFRGVMRFFKPDSAANIVANPDTAYMGSLFKMMNKGVAVIRFKPPVAAGRRSGLSYPDLSEPDQFDVRFFSICMTGGINLLTFQCLHDGEMVRGEDGFITIVVSTDDPRKLDPNLKTNFIRWPNEGVRGILYRHLLPSERFKGSIHNVKGLPKVGKRESLTEEQVLKFASDHYIGDYAPVGIHCTHEKCDYEAVLQDVKRVRRNLGIEP